MTLGWGWGGAFTLNFKMRSDLLYILSGFKKKKVCVHWLHSWKTAEQLQYVREKEGSVSPVGAAQSRVNWTKWCHLKSLERGGSGNYVTCCCSSESIPLIQKQFGQKKNKMCYLKSLQSGLFLLQGLLLLLLIHAAERHAGGGERWNGVRQGGCSANTREKGRQQRWFIYDSYFLRGRDEEELWNLIHRKWKSF